ncbi:MAG TPA: hypothetical protein VK654_04725 [Nitrospirota bacterium]|nr:hypothetical protein [Nitrospirota bacterium]
MKKQVVLLLLLLLPAIAFGQAKKHAQTAPDQECSECHAAQSAAWESGKHGLMNVKCVVCHGSPEENYIPKPDTSRCIGCHASEVADLSKKKAPSEKTCAPCHDRHTLAVKTVPKTPFHSQGGQKP